MKYQLLNNEPLQFFNAEGVLIGTIEISGSGDMLIRPESGSSKDIILGNRDTVGDVEIGLPSAEANLKLMGGGLITANGNTLTIGDSTVGDQLIFGAPITASNVQTASFAISASHLIGGGGGSVPAGTVSGSAQIALLGFVSSSITSSMSVFSASNAVTASHALNPGTTVVANPGSSGDGALSTVTIGAQNFSVGGGGGGGGGIFTASAGYQQTINNLIISESNATSSLSVINSGSTIFDVQGSVGQLFEVQDGLDGILMSVNDISGIPILTVSSSGDVILAAGSTLQGTAATASFVAGVSAAFPFAGAGVITGSLDITGSGDDIFKVKSSSGSLFSVDDGLDGILMSVNDISGLPLFEVSSSGNVLLHGDISGSIESTASFGHLLVNGVSISGSGAGGGGGSSFTAAGISGSFGAPSASFSTRVTANESNVTTLTSNISSLTGATGSYATTGSVSLNTLTISNLSGSLIPGNGSTSSIAVTVDGNQKFVLDGTVTASISLTAGNAYRFDQSDNTNNNHPIAFKISGSSDNYTTLVSASGVPGNAAASTLISVTNATPNLTYYCTVHGTGMGGDGKGVLTIITGSQIQNGFLEVSGSTRLSGSFKVVEGEISSSRFFFKGASDPGLFHIGLGAKNSSNTNVVIGPGASATVGSYRNVVIGNSTTVGGGYRSVLVGEYIDAPINHGVLIGDRADATVGGSISIGSLAGNGVSAQGINIGYQAKGSGVSNIVLNSTYVSVTPTKAHTFGVYTHGTQPVLEIEATGSSLLTGSSFTIEKSGSTLFEVIGSEGTIFSLDDNLDGELFTVNDRSGIPQLLVSSSGRIEAEEGESVIRSQRPIVTVATNPFTASAANVGQYFRVGGNITCSIFVTASAHCPIGAEFDFFQTSSVGNMLFETGSGVTLNSKNSNLNLAGQFSSATLKYIGLDEWDLMGDLT